MHITNVGVMLSHSLPLSEGTASTPVHLSALCTPYRVNGSIGQLPHTCIEIGGAVEVEKADKREGG
jgi:hypothetical protein